MALNGNDLEDKLYNLCATWYSEDHPVTGDDEGYFEQDNGCETVISECKEILESTYNDLKGYL